MQDEDYSSDEEESLPEPIVDILLRRKQEQDQRKLMAERILSFSATVEASYRGKIPAEVRKAMDDAIKDFGPKDSTTPTTAAATTSSSSSKHEERSSSTEVLMGEDDDMDPTKQLRDTVVQIQLIWKKIASYLSLQDLKNCRQVSKIWTDVATQSMQNWKNCGVMFEYKGKRYVEHPKREDFQHSLLAALKCNVLSTKDRQSLADLNKCLRQSNKYNNNNKFPSTHFGFWGGRVCEQSPIEDFFNIQGLFIKTLWLFGKPHPCPKIQKKTLIDILLNKAPNVETLSISNFCIDWTDKDRLTLPNLKFLTCYTEDEDHGRSTAFDMLKSAPNLKKVYNFRTNYIQFFLSSPHLISTIKSYSMEFSHVNLDCQQKFASSGVTLESLSIIFKKEEDGDYDSDDDDYDSDDDEYDNNDDYDYERRRRRKVTASAQEKDESLKIKTKVLNEILKSSQNTLIDLTLSAFLGSSLKGLQIPTLTRLKKLYLMDPFNFEKTCPGIIFLRSSTDERIFPSQFNFASTFPQLETVTLYLDAREDDTWSDYFPESLESSLDTVKCLRIKGNFSTKWLQNLQNLFPAVSKLTLADANAPTETMMRDICQLYPTLQEFTCIWNWSGFGDSTTLDGFLTGIPHTVCETKLKKMTKKENCDCYDCEAEEEDCGCQEAEMKEWPDIEEVQTGSSICDLKCLKRLNIVIPNIDRDASEDEGDYNFFNVISRISGVYAFQRKPTVEVTIFYHQHCSSSKEVDDALKSIAPFVKIRHETNFKKYFDE